MNSKQVWKAFGKVFSESADNIKVYSIFNNRTTNTVALKGKCNEEGKYYSGFIYWINNDHMYISLKYNKYWGYESKTSDFDIVIPYKTNMVKKIYIASFAKEIQVWPVK